MKKYFILVPYLIAVLISYLLMWVSFIESKPDPLVQGFFIFLSVMMSVIFVLIFNESKRKGDEKH